MTHYGFSALAFGSLLCHYIDFAVKSIAKIIGDFGDVTIKQQITEFAEGTARVGQAHPELANVLAFVLRSSIDRRDHLPTATAGIDIGFRLGVEFRIAPVAGPNAVDLRGPRTRMP